MWPFTNNSKSKFVLKLTVEQSNGLGVLVTYKAYLRYPISYNEKCSLVSSLKVATKFSFAEAKGMTISGDYSLKIIKTDIREVVCL